MFKSIFGDKTGGARYQGVVTPVGSRRFEMARARLGKLASREADTVSDADVMEFLARGENDTKEFLEREMAKQK